MASPVASPAAKRLRVSTGAQNKVSEVLHTMVEVEAKAKLEADMQAILQSLREAPHLVPMVRAFIQAGGIPREVKTEFYRGVRTLKDIPQRDAFNLASEACQIPKARLVNIPDAKSQIHNVLCFALGVSRSHKLESLSKEVVGQWMATQYEANGKILASLKLDQPLHWSIGQPGYFKLKTDHTGDAIAVVSTKTGEEHALKLKVSAEQWVFMNNWDLKEAVLTTCNEGMTSTIQLNTLFNITDMATTPWPAEAVQGLAVVPPSNPATPATTSAASSAGAGRSPAAVSVVAPTTPGQEPEPDASEEVAEVPVDEGRLAEGAQVPPPPPAGDGSM